jgi:hypothetical protein
MKINLNDKVRVQLTEHGRQVHWDEWKALADHCLLIDLEYEPPVEDSQGWSEWLLWELMRTFGKHMCNGGSLPFEPAIVLSNHEEREAVSRLAKQPDDKEVDAQFFWDFVGWMDGTIKKREAGA